PARARALRPYWRPRLRVLNTRDRALRYQAERDRLVREFTERAALSRAMPADAGTAWADEANALVRGHLAALEELRARTPGQPAPLGAVEATAAERNGQARSQGKGGAGDRPGLRRRAVRAARDGKYAPQASAVAGGLRLDLSPLQTGVSPAGHPGLRVDFALWRAPRLVNREASGEGTQRPGSASRSRSPTLAMRFLKADGTEFARMDGPGEPYIKLADPERFVQDFPPGLLVGTWWLPLLPRDAEKVELTVDADVRGASGGNRPAVFTVTLPVQEGWRAPPGTEAAGPAGR
ncbi:MAG: hypothetical protein QM767_12680, partial [Anaeromyxobacter sp.]